MLNQMLECLNERLVRQVEPLVAAACEHQRAGRVSLARDLADQPSLTDAGLPSDECASVAGGCRPLEQLGEPLALRLAVGKDRGAMQLHPAREPRAHLLEPWGLIYRGVGQGG